MSVSKKKNVLRKLRGRPRTLIDGSIAFNVRLDPSAWAELHAKAERKGVPMSDLVRDALGEWLLACSQGQRPITARGT